MLDKDKKVPEQGYAVNNLGALQKLTADNFFASQMAPATSAFDNAKANLGSFVTKKIMEPIAKIFEGKRPAGWEQAADAFHDRQLNYNNRIDLLDALLDYGAVYMETIGGFLEYGKNYGVMPFNRQIGPMRGCELLSNGGVKLKAAGLWNVTATLTFQSNAINVGSGHVDWRVRVYDPAGELYSERISYSWNQRNISPVIVMPVVVPEPGYVVKVEVAWVHGSRRLPGGYRYTGLVCQRISSAATELDMGTSPDIDTTQDKEATNINDTGENPPEPEPEPEQPPAPDNGTEQPETEQPPATGDETDQPTDTEETP